MVAPKPFSVTPIISGVVAAQSATGLAANTPLAALTEFGGVSGDTYVYIARYLRRLLYSDQFGQHGHVVHGDRGGSGCG